MTAADSRNVGRFSFIPPEEQENKMQTILPYYLIINMIIFFFIEAVSMEGSWNC